MASWKTTLAGVGTILATIGNAIHDFMVGGLGGINFAVLASGLTAGVGLIAARDNNVTSVQAGAGK